MIRAAVLMICFIMRQLFLVRKGILTGNWQEVNKMCFFFDIKIVSIGIERLAIFMKISACYITKNEEENIKRSIESLQGQADEVIVVDTGSVDGTVKAAERMGAQVYHYSWQKDFAAARNFALSKATGDWLILLDADEYFTEETAGNIRILLEEIDGKHSCVFVQMVNWDQDRDVVQDRFYQLRLVKNLSGLGYMGVVHEELYVNGKIIPAPVRVKPNILQIIHTGYSKGNSRQKLLRNLELLEEEIKKPENVDNLSRYLCITYLDLGNVEKGLYYGWHYVCRGKHTSVYAAQCHRVMLEYYAKREDRQSVEKRFELAEISAGQFPELPDFHAEYGECLFLQGRFREAREQLKLALELWQGYDGMEPCCLSEDMRPVMEQRAELFGRLAERAEKISISACVICRDEIANIAGWLTNVRRFANELVVVDTGSVDGTREFLTENSVPYFSYEWQDDFAAARNFALDRAHGDWIIFLDADETLQYPDDIRGNILRLIDRQPEAEALLLPLENIDADNNGMLIDTDQVIRIFRNKPDLRYVGAIHEQLRSISDVERDLSVAEANVLFTVRHTGYSSGIVQSKLKRNLMLILREISEGNKELYYGHLAACYYGLGAYQAALDYALLAIASVYRPAGKPGEPYWLALEAMQKLDYALEDKLAVAEAALSEAGDIPDFYGYKGYLLAEGRQWKQASLYLSKGEEIYAVCLSGDGLTASGSSRYGQLVSQFRTALARCHVKLGELVLGRQEYVQVLVDNRWYEDALKYYLDSFCRRRGEIPAEAAQVFSTVYSEKTDRRMLCSWLEQHGYTWQTGAACFVVEERPSAVRDILTDLAVQVQLLFVSLLNMQPDFSSRLVQEQLKLLPEGLASLVYYFHGKKEGWGNVDAANISCAALSCEAYDSMKNAVYSWGTRSVKERYENIGRELGREVKKQ